MAHPMESVLILRGSSSSAIRNFCQRGFAQFPERMLMVAGLIVLLAYALVALAHVTDRYQVNFVSGVYAGLAMHLNAGTFYPTLYDGNHYGGTRYMPLQFCLHAGLARLTGEYLVSGKILTSLLSILLLMQIYYLCRWLQCGRGISLFFTSLVVLTDPGLVAMTTIRGDLLPVVLQLAAVMVLFQTINPKRTVLAALLCTLAILSKVSAIWAGAAITWHLIQSQRRQALLFLVLWLGLTILAVFGINHLSSGKMLMNMGIFSGSGISLFGTLIAPFAFLWRVAQSGAVLTLIVPLVVFGWFQSFRCGEIGLQHRAFAMGLLATLGVYLDKEVTNNHLLDLMVLCLPVLAGLWSWLPRSQVGTIQAPRSVLALGMLWSVYMGFGSMLLIPAFDVLQHYRMGDSRHHHPAIPLANVIGIDDSILCEDPWLAISRGHLPVVLDPYSLGRISQNRPELVQPLLQQIQNRSIRWIVVSQELNDRNLLDRHRWEDRHFGPCLVQAMRDNYTLFKRISGYFVYAPMSRDGVGQQEVPK